MSGNSVRGADGTWSATPAGVPEEIPADDPEAKYRVPRDKDLYRKSWHFKEDLINNEKAKAEWEEMYKADIAEGMSLPYSTWEEFLDQRDESFFREKDRQYRIKVEYEERLEEERQEAIRAKEREADRRRIEEAARKRAAEEEIEERTAARRRPRTMPGWDLLTDEEKAAIEKKWNHIPSGMIDWYNDVSRGSPLMGEDERQSAYREDDDPLSPEDIRAYEKAMRSWRRKGNKRLAELRAKEEAKSVGGGDTGAKPAPEPEPSHASQPSQASVPSPASPASQPSKPDLGGGRGGDQAGAKIAYYQSPTGGLLAYNKERDTARSVNADGEKMDIGGFGEAVATSRRNSVAPASVGDALAEGDTNEAAGFTEASYAMRKQLLEKLDGSGSVGQRITGLISKGGRDGIALVPPINGMTGMVVQSVAGYVRIRSGNLQCVRPYQRWYMAVSQDDYNKYIADPDKFLRQMAKELDGSVSPHGAKRTTRRFLDVLKDTAQEALIGALGRGLRALGDSFVETAGDMCFHGFAEGRDERNRKREQREAAIAAKRRAAFEKKMRLKELGRMVDDMDGIGLHREQPLE